MLFLYVTVIALVVRLLIYTGPFRPPISLRGRIATGRWVIPGYDYVLLAPLCTLLTALVGLVLAISAGLGILHHLLSPRDGRGIDRRFEHGTVAEEVASDRAATGLCPGAAAIRTACGCSAERSVSSRPY